MLKKFLGIAFLGLLVATSSIKCDEDAADNEATNFAVELNAENFNEALQKNNHFIMFFAPWCGHCKRLHPLWEQLAEMMNVKDEPKVIIAKVDCTKEQTLCGNNEITGYPTLRFFKLGATESVKFKGTRDMPAITEFINQQLDSEEDNELPQNGDGNAAAGDSQQAALYELTEDNFAKHVSTGNHFVKFYAPWCSHCQRLAPTWDKLAESLKSEQAVSIAKIDCTVYRPVCQDFDVKGYPTLLWIEDGKKIEKYSGSRDHEALKDYVEKMLGADGGRKEAAPEEAEAKPTAEDKLQVLQLSGDNFAKSVETGVTFVKFYAPWCGHCQKLSPTWDQLAAKLHAVDNGIKIAKVDCTAADNRNLCSDEQVEGYPTLFAYKDGVKQTEYNGGRSLADLQHYISNMQGHTEL